METSIIEGHSILSVFSVHEVERRIGEVPDLESVTVKLASGSATVRYDENRLDVADIKSVLRQLGHERPASLGEQATQVALAAGGNAYPDNTPQHGKTAPIEASRAPDAVAAKRLQAATPKPEHEPKHEPECQPDHEHDVQVPQAPDAWPCRPCLVACARAKW
jgi:Cu2+-exporting ATPase